MPARQRDNHDSGDQHSHLSHDQQDHFGLVGHHYESLYNLRLDQQDKRWYHDHFRWRFRFIWYVA